MCYFGPILYFSANGWLLVSDTKPDTLILAQVAHRALHGLAAPFDLEIVSEAHFENTKDVTGTSAVTASRSGVRIF